MARQCDLLFFCLAILLVTAGCAAGPFGGSSHQDQPVQLAMNNSANATQTFEVWVVDREANATVHRDDGLTTNYTIGQGLAGHSSGDYHTWEAVDLPNSAELHGRFTVEPGEEEWSSIEEFPLNYAVVVVLYQDDKIGWWASASCNRRTLIGLEINTRPDQYGDAWTGYECR